MKAIPLLRWLLVALLGWALLGCSSKSPSKLDLLPGQKQPGSDLSAAQERVRRLQMIRVINPTTKAESYLRPEDFNTDVLLSCQIELCDETVCSEDCYGKAYMCQAKTMLALTRPQAAPVTVGNYLVPEQTPAETQSLASLGQAYAATAAANFTNLLLKADGLASSTTCPNPLDEYPSGSGLSAAAFAGEGLADAYDLYKQLGDTYVTASVNFADSELNVSTSVKTSAQLAMTQRVAATKKLGGTVDALPNAEFPEGTFCTRPSLTPAVRAAIAIIRDAAPLPSDLLDTSLLTDSFVNAIGGTVTGGSIRQRLAEFYWGALDPSSGATTTLPNGKTVSEQYGLDLDTFREARVYLQQEFMAFGRSKTAELPRRTIPDGTLATYHSYAGTGTTPQFPPAAYYGALVRQNNDLQSYYYGQFPLGLSTTLYDADSPNKTLPAFQVAAHGVIDGHNWQYSLLRNSADSDPVLGPVGLVVADHDYLGFVDVFTDYDSNINDFNRAVRVHGFSTSDGIKLATTEDDLRCAVQGSVEGAHCSLANLVGFDDETPGSYAPASLYSSQAVAHVSYGSHRVYLLKQRALGGTQASGPGAYEALIGLDVTVDPNEPYRGGGFAIVRGSDERIAGLIEPGPNWCTRPQVSCNGQPFDARISLENELTSDGNASEDSWRHYLDLAKSAADEADTLGKDYIDTELALAQNAQSNERADEQQTEQANAQLSKLQDLCGFQTDTQSLLKLLNPDGKLKTAYGQCDETPGSCQPGYVCTGYLSGSQPGTCNLVIESYLHEHDSDPDIKRIEQCITNSDNIAFVSLGDVPLCLWADQNDQTKVCKKLDGTNAARTDCPQRLTPERVQALTWVKDFSSTDEETLDAIHTQCAGQLQGVKPTTALTYATVPMGYFNMADSAPPSAATLINYALIRGMAPSNWLSMRDRVIASNDLDPNALAETIQGLDWESRFDDYGAIKYLGTELFTTGDPTSTIPATKWPCNGGSPWTGDTRAAPDCSTVEGRQEANSRLFKAVAAAKALGPVNEKQLYAHDEGGNPLVPFGLIKHRQNATQDSKQCDSFWSTVETIGVSIGTLSPTSVCVTDPYKVNCGSVNPQEPTCDSETVVTRASTQAQILQVSCGTGTAYTDPLLGPDETGDLTANLGCFHHSRLHLQTHSTTDSALLGMSSVYPSKNSDGWVLDYLNGKASLTDKVATYSWYTDSAFIPGGTGSSGHHTLELSGTDLMNAIGLVMYIKQAESTSPLVSLDHPPVVKTVDDLEAVRQYTAQLAAQIRANVGSLTFANVPTAALDALRQDSALGAYPGLSGALLQDVRTARTAMLAIHTNGPLLANEVQGISDDIHALKLALRQANIQEQINSVGLAAQVTGQLASCAGAVAGVAASLGLGSLGAAVTCANSIAQIGYAQDIAALADKNTVLQGELAITDFGSKFTAHSTAMQTLSTQVLTGAEQLDGALGAINDNANVARSTLLSAIRTSSFQAQHAAEVTNVLANLGTAKQRRYESALQNAKNLSFVAKRAIEQRLALHLSDVTDDYPLVDAPAKWESGNCSMTGLEYSSLTQSVGDNPQAPQNYVNGFIGDYVRKLQNFVDSYALQNNFHEGTDTAVISLRDDLMNVRKSCAIGTSNILFNAGQLDQTTQPGWTREACPRQTVDGVDLPVEGCIDAIPLVNDAPLFADQTAAQTKGYELQFGAAAGVDSAIVEALDLPAGRFRFSWYTKEDGTHSGTEIIAPWSGGADAATIRGDTPPVTWEDGIVPADGADMWNRRYIIFRLDAPETVRIGFQKPGTAGTTTVAAPMLEQLQDVDEDQALKPFVNTTGERTEILPACEDDDGSTFRATRWHYDCVKLCADGFADHCTEAKSKDYCYWEAEFGLSQRDIQLGKVFNYSGFARGNFNYRIDSVGVNFVGTATRDCSQSSSPQTCYGAGYIPYSLSHVGPFYVRNYKGDDVETKLFDGNIEHARGLASERYLTNPLSSADDGLIQQYMRSEFAGRPLDGNFVLRVWDEDGVDFNAIQDVQIVLNYRYWTKFN